MGFCSGEEDTVSMAMTVFERLMRSTGLGLEEIGRLEVGTESQVDRAKSTKSFLMGFFQPEGLHSVEGLDTYNACYGGTNALFSTVGWVQSAAWSGQYGVVVCSDPAVHPQQEALSGIGASAVGLLVGCEEAMVVEPVRVSFIKHAWCGLCLLPRSTDWASYWLRDGQSMSVGWSIGSFGGPVQGR